MGLVRCRSESGLEGADLLLGSWCVVCSSGPGQEWNVSVLGVVQQLVGPGEDCHIAGGGGGQQWVRPGVEGRTAGLFNVWYAGVGQAWRGLINCWG